MANLNFYLRDPNSKNLTTINLSVRWQGMRCYLSTGEKVIPKYWDPVSQRVKKVKGFPNHHTVNKELDYQMNLTSEIFNNHESEVQEYTRFLSKVDSLGAKVEVRKTPPKRMTIERFKKLWRERRKNPFSQESMETDLFDFINKEIKRKEDFRKPGTGERLSKKTIYKYKELRDSLKEFDKNFSFVDITEDKINEYRKFLEGHGKNSLGELREDGPLSLNTIGKYFSVFRSVLNSARARNMKFSDEWMRSLKAISEESTSTYLTETEIERLFDLDLSEKPHLERVRDLFVVGCWTGFRYSDLHQLNEKVIHGDFITIKTKKTNHLIVVPVHFTVKKILEKYSYKLPKAISNQKFNDYIKKVAELAGFDEPFVKEITIGGRKQKNSVIRFQIVTSHTARRSFATNLYKSGFPVISIMKITGHKTEKSFLKYIKVTPQEHAELLMKFWVKQKELWEVI